MLHLLNLSYFCNEAVNVNVSGEDISDPEDPLPPKDGRPPLQIISQTSATCLAILAAIYLGLWTALCVCCRRLVREGKACLRVFGCCGFGGGEWQRGVLDEVQEVTWVERAADGLQRAGDESRSLWAQVTGENMIEPDSDSEEEEVEEEEEEIDLEAGKDSTQEALDERETLSEEEFKGDVVKITRGGEV